MVVLFLCFDLVRIGFHGGEVDGGTGVFLGLGGRRGGTGGWLACRPFGISVVRAILSVLWRIYGVCFFLDSAIPLL